MIGRVLEPGTSRSCFPFADPATTRNGKLHEVSLSYSRLTASQLGAMEIVPKQAWPRRSSSPYDSEWQDRGAAIMRK
jgi:hypothetical protein